MSLNCPFCHLRAEVAGQYKMYCKHCYGEPLWQNYPPDSAYRLSYINFRIKGSHDVTTIYYPTINKIELRFPEKTIEFAWFQEVTPNNLDDTISRLKKLLVFL